MSISMHILFTAICTVAFGLVGALIGTFVGHAVIGFAAGAALGLLYSGPITRGMS